MKKLKIKTEKLPQDIVRSAWVLAFGALAPMLDSTMVNIAINKLQIDLNTSLNMIQWAITGYVLALAVAIPVCGFFVNHFNGKIVLQVATIAFGLFSMFSGLAWNIQSFIFFRAIQGFSAGFLTLLMSTLLMKIAPKDKLGQLIAVVSTPLILGPIIGPVLGGLLVQYADWHWIFFVNIPIVVITVLLNLFFLQDFDPMNPESRLDWIGTLLLALGSTGLIYGLMKGSDNASHFFNSPMLLFSSLGLLVFIIYGIYNHLKDNETVLPLHFFKVKNFTAANIAVFLAGIASNGPMLLLPLFFQNTRSLSTIEAALMLIPQGIGMLIARPLLGKAIDRFGARPVVLVSLFITLLGTFPLVIAGDSTNLYWIGLVLFVRGIGVGGLIMPMMTDIFIGLKSKDIAAASVGNRIIQNLGSSFGSAIISAVVTSVITSQLAGQVTNSLNKLMNSTSTNSLPFTAIKVRALAQASKIVTLHAYQSGFAVSCFVLVLIIFPTFFLSSKLNTK